MDSYLNKNFSLVAISDIKIKETIQALTKSHKLSKPTKTILFTSKSVTLKRNESKIINIIQINEIKSLKDYSHFIIYSLHKYIDSTHVLIVQWDGYVINGQKWNKSFLNYDYIGAPFIPRFKDESYSRDKNGGFHAIGNGGFSMRSKRLLEAPTKYKLVDNFSFTNYHEDGFFSVYHRYFFESKGFLWAPFSIANNFSIESPISIKDLKELPFGFHGRKMIFFLKIITAIKNLSKILKLTS